MSPIYQKETGKRLKMTLRPDQSLWEDFIHSNPFLNATSVPLGADDLLVDNTKSPCGTW